MLSDPSLDVLVVDDDKVIALLHKSQLRLHGITGPRIICKNGLEALDYILNNNQPKKQFLVFLDLNMPILNGWKFLKQLKIQAPEVKVHVIIVTSSISKKDMEKARKFEKVKSFCQKPLTSGCIDKILALDEIGPLMLSLKMKPKAQI